MNPASVTLCGVLEGVFAFEPWEVLGLHLECNFGVRIGTFRDRFEIFRCYYKILSNTRLGPF